MLELAFTHRSFAYETGISTTNERLEFLGDSVLGLIVTEELYIKYPDLDESRLSPLRSGIVNMRALADIARTLELGQYIRLGKGEEVTNGRDKNSLLADALEALIGAIYLESGFAQTSIVVNNLIKETLESAMAKGAGAGAAFAAAGLAVALAAVVAAGFAAGLAAAFATGLAAIGSGFTAVALTVVFLLVAMVASS